MAKEHLSSHEMIFAILIQGIQRLMEHSGSILWGEAENRLSCGENVLLCCCVGVDLQPLYALRLNTEVGLNKQWFRARALGSPQVRPR